MASPHAPDYRITLDGQVITPRISGRLSQLRLTDNRGLQADQLDLTLTDDDGRLALPRRGVSLALAIGWRGEGLVDRGTYIVDEVEYTGAPDLLHVRARSADLRERMPGKRTKSWHDVTLGDILKTIAGRYGLDPAISDKFQQIAIDHIDQTNESDINFLTRLGLRFDAIAAVKSKHLLFLTAGQSATASGQPIPAVIITKQSGDNYRYSETDRNAYTGVIAKYHDTDEAEEKQSLAGSDDNPKTLRETWTNKTAADAAAKAEWQRLQRGEAQFSITLANGRPNLYPETPIVAQGFKDRIDRRPWLLTQVTHSLGGSAYTTDLALELRNP